jgi:excisionase family DNA binding protein
VAESEFLSVAQAAEALGITRQAVLKRIRTGRLDATKVGRNYVIARRSLAASTSPHDPVLAEIVRRLVAAYQPERVYLFGSAARGEAGPDSDHDVLLVVPDDADAERLRSRRAYEALWGLGVAVDVLVWRRSAFDARATVRTSLPATILREGILLHAA